MISTKIFNRASTPNQTPEFQKDPWLPNQDHQHHQHHYWVLAAHKQTTVSCMSLHNIVYDPISITRVSLLLSNHVSTRALYFWIWLSAWWFRSVCLWLHPGFRWFCLFTGLLFCLIWPGIPHCFWWHWTLPVVTLRFVVISCANKYMELYIWYYFFNHYS